MEDNINEVENTKPVQSEQEKAELARLQTIHEWQVLFRDNPKQGSFKIANELVSKHCIKTIGNKKEREIMLYENGMYRPGVNQLRFEIQKLLEHLGTNPVKNEAIEKIKDLTIAERSEFNVDRDYINLANGIFNIKTREITPHNPDYLFLHKLPITYNPEAKCPVIQKFLSDILQPEDIPVIQEWFGYCLYRSYFIKKAMILVGERDTGKTTLLRLLSTFIGRENVAGISLQRIATDKFAAAQMYNKHINVYDDLSFKDIHDNGAFKIATGGGIITGEYKFGDQFQFENYAKLVFACNKIPNVEDANDDAYFSRWIVLQFNQAVEKPDKFLIDKMTTPEELSGLLNFALEGLDRLLETHEFSYAKDPDQIKIEMLRSGSIIANFVYDCLIQSDNQWISKERMFNSFSEYAKERKMPAGTIAEFGKKLPKYASYIHDSRQLQGNKQITGWRNVQLKEDIKDAERAAEIMGGEIIKE